MTSLPRITVITPSFNQGQYLEQTIRSVLDQNYPNLEYMVVDGASSDESPAIIERYAEKLAWWVSEQDRGQTHALNKGLARATGDVLAYINSDDWYFPGALQTVGEHFRDHPETDFLYGRCVFTDEGGTPFKTHQGNINSLEELLDLWNVWWGERQFVQPECFWSRRVFQEVPRFREDIDNAFDYEYWTRIFQAGARPSRVNADLCCFRFQPNQKSADAEKSARELLAIVEKLLWDPDVQIAPATRRALKANWLYHCRFLRAVETSIAAGESKARRWLRLAGVLLRHPGILRSEKFQQRRRARAGSGNSSEGGR